MHVGSPMADSRASMAVRLGMLIAHSRQFHIETLLTTFIFEA